MAITIVKRNRRSVSLRRNQATSQDGGTYNIAELAYTETIDGRDYTKSIGATYRNDEISDDLRTIQRAEDAEERAQRDAVAVRARDVLTASEKQSIIDHVDDCVDNNKELYPEHPVTGQPVVDATPAVAAAAVL